MIKWGSKDTCQCPGAWAEPSAILIIATSDCLQFVSVGRVEIENRPVVLISD